MTRLNPEPVSTEEIRVVISDPELVHGAKVVWTHLRIVADPQSQKAIADAVHMDVSTVARLVRALEAKGLARKVHGVWLAEEGR